MPYMASDSAEPWIWNNNKWVWLHYLLILIGKLQNMNYFPIENSSLMSHKSGHSSLFAIETYCSIFFQRDSTRTRAIAKLTATPQCVQIFFWRRILIFFTIVFSKDSPLIGLPSQIGFQVRLKILSSKIFTCKSKM